MILDQRLELVQYWQSEEYKKKQSDISAPVFVVGLPRTGTSFLHTLLAQDTENFQSPLNWMVVGDVVPPLAGSVDDDDTPRDEPAENAALRKSRVAEASSNIDQFKMVAKGVDAQHTMTAFRPEECIVFLSHVFTTGWEFLTYFHVPSYGNWLRDRPSYTDAFRWHKQFLQHLGSATPAGQGPARPWLVKTPFYMAMLDDLVTAYPDARVIWTHRRPVKALTSLASLQMKLRSVSTDRMDPKGMADEIFKLWDAFAGRALDARQSWDGERQAACAGRRFARGCSARPGGGLVDVELGELHKKPMAAVRKIYDGLGLKLSEATDKKMRRWLEDNGREKHGKNTYAQEWFGLNSSEHILQAHEGLHRYDDFLCKQLFPSSCGLKAA
jgi:hypothetical protein